MDQKQTQQMWDLWNLRTIFPDHGPLELTRILEQGKAFDREQENFFASPHKALAKLEHSAQDFLIRNPDLKSGLVISLHLGPYSLAPVPWLIAGIDVHILVNKLSLADIKPIYDNLDKHLPLPGKITWIPIEGNNFAVKIIRALRQRNVVFAFLDGNDGLGGSTETLREGMTYKLPGRNIKVRTGLARLAARCNAPIHSVVTMNFTWERGPTWALNQNCDPQKTTKNLFDWAFGVIKKHPHQWKCWNMLTGVYETFGESETIPGIQSIPDVAIITWTGRGKLWPGNMLEDTTGHCFYSAEGLSSLDIHHLTTTQGITKAALKKDLGNDWACLHLPRLAALGFVSVG